MSLSSQPYAENGVFISDYSLGVGDEVTITYEGILAKSGADQIFLHIGYGKEWLDKAFIPMENENGVFKGSFKITLQDELNISFKDSADNWDNNSFMNYSVKFAGKAKAAKKSTAKTTAKAAEKKEDEAESKEVKKTAKASAEKKSSTKSKSKSSEDIKELKAPATTKKASKSASTEKTSTKTTKASKDK